MTATAATPLMKNAHRHDSRSVNSPPKMAPVVNPAAISDPFSPNARSRSGPSGNDVVSSDKAAGVTIAVAIPWASRAVNSTAGSVAKPPAREDPPSKTIPVRKRRLRPNTSAAGPNISVNPAAHSAKVVAIEICSAPCVSTGG